MNTRLQNALPRVCIGTILSFGGLWVNESRGQLVADRAEVVYGGFAFSGNADAITNAYPLARAFDQSKGADQSVFEGLASKLFQSQAATLSGIHLKFGIVDKSQCPRVLALALTEERVLRESMGDLRKLVIQLGFELLILDFTQRQVVCSVPIFIELIDARKAEFTHDDVVGRIGEMVIGEHSQLGEVLVRKLHLLKARPNNALTLQVTAVDVGEKALPFLPTALREKPTIFSQGVAQQFGSLFSSQAGVALLPYAKDGVNTKMTLRFTAAQETNFLIPKPTFAIRLNAKGFKKVRDKQTDAEALWIYGAWLGVKVYDPDFGKVYFETTAKYPVSKLVPASQVDVDDFPVVSEALKGAILSAIEMMQQDNTANQSVILKCQL